MRVCHKCGYIDDAIWKHLPFSYYIDGCSYDNFKMGYPELGKKIMNGLVEDEYYVYRLSKNKRWVQRKAKIDYGWHPDFEKTPDTIGGMTIILTRKKGFGKKLKKHADHIKEWLRWHPNQTKLFEEAKP